jgi:hypothetical protein
MSRKKNWEEPLPNNCNKKLRKKPIIFDRIEEIKG